MVEGRQILKIEKIENKYGEWLKDEYCIIRLLSRSGGFGTVLKGKKIGEEKWEAIKAINIDCMSDAGLSIEKVEQEINILGKLDYKHIIKLHKRIRKTTKERDYIFIITHNIITYWPRGHYMNNYGAMQLNTSGYSK